MDRPDLKFPPRNAGRLKALRKNGSVFKLVKQSPILLHHPYQSFDPVVQMIREAAADPDVLAVKMTIYRTGSNSELVRALMKAALAGKQVTVVVELMARFDEANNVNWAKQLEEAGAHVVYGVFGYKVHAKMALVIRREDGVLKRYAHLGTGNYHQGTSRIFHNNGADDTFISSADWMGRNFFRRIEVATPITTPELKERVIREGLEMALEDNTQAWLMQPDGSYVRTQPKDGEPAFGLQEGLWKIYGR